MSVALESLVRVSTMVAGTRSRLRKVGHLAAFMQRLPADELAVSVAYLAGTLPQGRIGVGPSLIREMAGVEPASSPSLTVAECHDRIDGLQRIEGPGSAARRKSALGAIYSRAATDEQRFLSRLLLGEIRQGALEGVMVEAIASAYQLTPDEVRRALMISGDLPAVAVAAAAGGAAGLAEFTIEPFTPLRPMLASPAADVTTALDGIGTALLEYKLDGARVQVHREGDRVRIFSRQMNDVTVSLPEIVRDVRALPVRSVILDGECLALRDDGRPQPFQVTMRRFGRRTDVTSLQASIPLTGFHFDCLYLDGVPLIDQPTRTRLEALDALLPEARRMPRTITNDPQVAGRFFRTACEAGHEGLMAKHPDARYHAGSRGAEWLKLKSAHTLDLVVLAAEWGSGRRRGWLSNLHLGAWDPQAREFVMLGKTFKGLTDRLLAWQTEALLARRIGESDGVVSVRPELVVEITFNDIQCSPTYAGGLALRFARVKRYRDDKKAHEADTIDTVRALFGAQRGNGQGHSGSD